MCADTLGLFNAREASTLPTEPYSQQTLDLEKAGVGLSEVSDPEAGVKREGCPRLDSRAYLLPPLKSLIHPPLWRKQFSVQRK